jgi:oligopeptidase B
VTPPRLAKARAPAPAARRVDAVTARHGLALPDPYRWLKADNWRDVLKDARALPEEIRAHLARENAHADRRLRPLAGLRRTLKAEIRARMTEDDASPPTRDGPFAYLERYREGGEHPLVVRTPREGGEETILIDGEAEAAGLPFFDLGEATPSPDHAMIAWSRDREGAERYEILARHLASMTDAEAVAGTNGSAVWTADGRGFFYVALDDNHRARRVLLHRLGAAQADDVLVHDEADQGFFVDIDETQDGRFLIIDLRDHETAEVRLVDLAAPDAPPRLVRAREAKVDYRVDALSDRLVILTNRDGAEDYKIATTPWPAAPDGPWTDIVAHRPGRLIEAFGVIESRLVTLETEDALPRIVLRPWTGGEETIAFEEPAYALDFDLGAEFATDTIRFIYTSMTTPAETYDLALATGARTLVKRQEIPSGHDPSRYETRRLFATAPDGESVPISLLMRRGQPLDGGAPLFLYAYGSYGYSMPASFSISRLSLVDRGFVHAIAHVRGGMEKGYRWYEDGKRERKTNTFDDFLAVARWLVGAGYTRAGRIVASGGSAGGLLMGAVLNRAPDLFAGVVADVPFVDPLNTMLDADLPLTPPEWPEWGNPIESEAAFRTIAAYSPYDTVAQGRRHPPVLAIAGLADPRVTYWEPAKWIARLRHADPDGGPFLLKTNMTVGHAGAPGRFEALDETALTLAFALAVTGAG